MSAKDAKEIIEKIVQSYESLKKICNDARERTKRDNSFAVQIIPFQKSKKTEDKEKIIYKYFDSLHEKIAEHYIIELIATFEQVIFKRIDNAYGEINTILSTEYAKRQQKRQAAPLYRCTNAFIKNKEDIRNLGGASKILENQLSKKSIDELDEIIKYRNWLTHGKREVGKNSSLKFEDINRIFLTIIDEIEGVSKEDADKHHRNPNHIAPVES